MNMPADRASANNRVSNRVDLRDSLPGFQMRSDESLTIESSSTYNNAGTFQYHHPTPGFTYAKATVILRKSDTTVSLGEVSKQYDLDGDGKLNEVEQAMRDRDRNNVGHLDNAEVYRIVEDQLRSQRDVKTYRKVAIGLVCLVAILALSNFGTSWASAILSKDTVADSESGTIQSKETGEVMGFQNAAFTFELDPLTDEEFAERRALVEAEMMEDPDHEDHQHRRLGENKNKIVYDYGKIQQTDLEDLINRCDGVNTVSVKRTWWRDRDSFYASDDDTICGPGTTVVRKGRRKNKKTNKKKNNKKKLKARSKKSKARVLRERVIDETITFRKEGKDRRDKSLSFVCKRGYCFASGGVLLQPEGHPCRLKRELDGTSDCDESLVCYDSDGETFGNGVCTRLQKYARDNQVCQINFGVDACEAGYACYSTNNDRKNNFNVGTINTGNCQRVMHRSGKFDVCDVSYGANACVDGYICLGANGHEIRRGIGYCATPPAVTVENTSD
ncbi:hypothetical protein ACHAXR_006939 [Thalassiosira sp. AJA248-18]